MANEAIESREFIRGAARLRDLIYVISRYTELVQEEVAHTSLIGIDDEGWGNAADTVWNSTAIAVARKPVEKAVVIGEEGDVVTYVGGNSWTEKIEPEPVLIRNAREIDGYVYACGMKRQVYRRAAENQWLDISAPVAGDTEAIGFEAIDGYGGDELYAVGWEGEIWQYDGRAWHQRNSPTNVILTALCCAADGVVYAAGQGGVMLTGRDDAWSIVQLAEEFTSDIWDLCWYGDKLYVATMTALYILDQGALVPVDFGGATPGSFYDLSAREDVLWSVGLHDIASFDGTKWTTYT